MGKFSKIFHHIESKDLRNKYEQKKVAKIKEEKKKEDTKKYIASVMEQVKYDWRSGFDIGATLREGMTTSDVAVTKQIDAAPGDGDVSSLDAIDSSSYTPTIGVLAANDDLGANVGTQIRASGSGTGQDGGFNVGGNYLAFQGTGAPGGGNARFAVLSPIDSTEIDTLKIKAIVGNDSNGGEDPDAAGEALYVMYKTRAMPEAMFLIQRPDGSIADGISGDEDTIIPVGAAPNAGLNDYSVTIPDYARAAGTQFILIQAVNSGVGFDNYGITEIKFQRKAPITVFVPLDNPEASSFIRSAPEGSTPKKRKKDVNDKLEASDQYTQAKFGNEFPGQEVRVGGEDPFKGAEIGDDVEPSPQSKDEVRKSFSKFSDRVAAVAPQTTVRGAPTAEPEAEPVEDPEVIATTQSKTATNDDGEPIEPKPVAAGAVQGADATNLDQDEPTEPEPIEPEPTSPDQEETEQELETEPDVEDKSEEELNQQLEDKTNALEKALTFQVTRDLNGFKNLVKVSKFAVQGFLGMLTIADRLNPFKQQNTETNDLQGGLSVLLNSLDIAMSVMDGKITKSNPTAAQINTYKNSILPSLFKGDINNTIPISDVRHEYADGNIYVERINGKAVIRDNTGGIRQDLTVKDKRGSVGGEYAGFGQVGGGYSQFIIPKDGGEPYIHFYDYNYHNINNDIDVSFEGGIIQSGGKVNASTISASLSNLIHQLRPSNTKLNIPARAKTSLIGYFTNFKDVLSALQTTSTLEGWPPGIHGAALTDITIPLSQLPKETQEMMAKHPLSWTPERIENMSDEQLYGQFYPLVETDEQFENYVDFTTDITKMSTEPVNTVPYAVAMQEIDEIYSEFEPFDQEFDELLEKPYNESPFTQAERAAYDDMQTLTAQRDKDIDENDKKLGPSAQSALYDKLVAPLYNSVKGTLDSGGTVSKATMDKLSRQYDKYKKQADKMDDDYYRIQGEINEKYYEQYDKLSEYYNAQAVSRSVEGYEGYPTTVDEKGRGDYTTLDGEVITSRFNQIKAHVDVANEVYDQIDALYEPVADLQRYVDGAFVREGIAERFEKDYGFSSESWSPKNKGGKSKPKSKPDPRASFAGTGADSATFTFDGTPDKDKDKNKNKNEELLLMYARPQPRRGLFEKVKSKGFFNQNDIKPIFPENPPPKLDPKTGMHPQYGKKANRYKKLDPISANSMPSTGDPEIDAVVNKQKTINKIKKMARNK